MSGDLGRRRSAAIERRRALEPTARSASAEQIARRVLDVGPFRGSSAVGLYVATGGEVDPATIGAEARNRGVSTWYPVATDGPMRFRRWDGEAPLQTGQFGVPVPPPGDEVGGTELDAVIVPLVLFGPGGLRVGRGGGHYDRTFAERADLGRPALLCGLAYDFQQDDELVAQPWDVPLDVVVTETRTLSW